MPKVDAVQEIIYPKIAVEVCGEGLPGVKDHVLSVEEAKKFIGWEEVIDGPVHLTDYNGNKIRLNNSSRNRPWVPALAKSYVSEVLHAHWQWNGETIIITRTGEVASGQHRLAAFILACQLFDLERDKWILHCGEEGPKLPCLIVKGISDDDKVINTIDTGKPRTLEDVLYRSDMFIDVKESERRLLVRILSVAISLFGDRIRAWDGELSQRRTHQDYLEMLERHPTLIDMAKFVWESDDEEKKVFKAFGLPPGTIAGMAYLMACSSTEDAANVYHRQDILTEENLSFEMRDKAESFITEVLDNPSFGTTFRKAREALYDLEGNDMGVDGRLITLVKAWNLYAEGKGITLKGITPKVVQQNGQPLVLDEDGVMLEEIPSPDGMTDDDGNLLMEPQMRRLDERPTVGGIDLAGDLLEDDRLSPTNGDETVIRQDPPKKPSKQFPKGKPAVIGAQCVVRDPEGDWTGKLLDVYRVTQAHIDAEPEWGATVGEERAEVQQLKGRKVWDVPYGVCHLLEE